MPGREINSQTKIYPIPVTIKTPERELRGQIHKLTIQGFLAGVSPSNAQPGEFVSASFYLNGSSNAVSVAGRVVKYYTQWTGGATGSVTGGVLASGSKAGSGLAASSLSAARESNSSQTPGGKSSSVSEGNIGHLMEVHFNDLPVSAVESISTFLRTASKIVRR